MKKQRLLICLLFSFLGIHQSFAQSNKGRCQVEVVSADSKGGFGYCGTSVVFKNNGNKTIDGITYQIYFYNKFDELLGSRENTWTDDGIGDDPIAPGKTERDSDSFKAFSDASYITVTIKKVHYTDRTICN